MAQAATGDTDPLERSWPQVLVSEISSWSPSLKIGLFMMAIITMLAVFAPVIAPYDPYYQDFDAILMPPGWAHLFGTDNLGRDIFSRVLHGARLDLQFGLIATYVPLTFGVLLGAIAGYRGGWFEQIVNAILSIAMAFPFLVLIIVVIAVLGPGIHNIYLSIFLVSWTLYARLARAEMLVERGKDYMTAARVLGYPQSRIILRHGLPNVITSALVFSMSDFVLNILALSSLSFIGLGIQPPIPEWGAMIAEGKEFLMQAWWVCTMPGFAVVVTGLALSLIGDGLARRLGDRHRSAA